MNSHIHPKITLSSLTLATKHPYLALHKSRYMVGFLYPVIQFKELRRRSHRSFLTCVVLCPLRQPPSDTDSVCWAGKSN